MIKAVLFFAAFRFLYFCINDKTELIKCSAPFCMLC